MRLLRHDLGLESVPAASPPRREDKRPIGFMATLLGLLLTVTWPPIVGVIVGAALWLWWGDAWWMKAGLVGGLLLGAVMSMGVLLSSFLLQRVLAPAPAAAAVAPAAPAMTTISYEPLDRTAARSDVRIVPMHSHRTIDSVDARDIAWMCYGLSRGTPHSLRAWLGRRTPSGETLDSAYWRAMCKPLRKAGIIVGAGPRVSGRLTTHDLGAMLAVLGLDASDAELWAHDAPHVEGQRPTTARY